MATIGYLDGVDSKTLDRLAAMDHQLVPLGTGMDDHGKKSLANLTQFDFIDLVITHFYKIRELVDYSSIFDSYRDIFMVYEMASTPIIVVTPIQMIDKVNEKLTSQYKEGVVVTSPAKLFEDTIKMIN
ncbi:MAG: hypothetical protein ACOCZX_03625 [Candidatus Bipolaricaulota bacterium]